MGDELVYVCEICQTVLDEHHCKAICPNCGRMFDCSDLPLLHANGQILRHEQYVPYPGSEADLLPPMTAENQPSPKASDAKTQNNDKATSESTADLP